MLSCMRGDESLCGVVGERVSHALGGREMSGVETVWQFDDAQGVTGSRQTLKRPHFS